MSRSMVILYVPEQEAARRFYEALLAAPPVLHVPGMTEFELPGGLLLGLMPEAGIRRLLPALAVCFRGDAPQAPPAPLRAELYLAVDDAEAWLTRALAAGARLLDPVAARPWGDRAGYALDPWGHVLALAETSSP
ncbi:MAG: VOC family protein [bacterium]|jgi:catechol 2,3-dioxygenase-like lactoylglutathione lyase family enzyme|nr:VOC family protein [bacterium]